MEYIITIPKDSERTKTNIASTITDNNFQDEAKKKKFTMSRDLKGSVYTSPNSVLREP